MHVQAGGVTGDNCLLKPAHTHTHTHTHTRDTHTHMHTPHMHTPHTHTHTHTHTHDTHTHMHTPHACTRHTHAHTTHTHDTHTQHTNTNTHQLRLKLSSTANGVLPCMELHRMHAYKRPSRYQYRLLCLVNLLLFLKHCPLPSLSFSLGLSLSFPLARRAPV